jgi:hypothetical protein
MRELNFFFSFLFFSLANAIFIVLRLLTVVPPISLHCDVAY